MTSNTECEGYTNWATFHVAMEYANSRDAYDRAQMAASRIKVNAPDMEVVKDGTWTKEEATMFTLADTLKEDIEAADPTARNADVYTGLMQAALSEVNWVEIAQEILSR